MPVLRALGICTNTAVSGATFDLMGRADGQALYSAPDAERQMPAPLRTRLDHALIDALADLCAIDPDAVSLDDQGKKDDDIGRHLKAWRLRKQ